MLKDRFKRFLKWGAAVLFYHSGAFSLIQSIHRKRKMILVLCYHKIGSEDTNLRPGLMTSAESFEKQIEFLKKNYEIICETQFGKIMMGEKKYPSKLPCLITFDDGWHDVYTNVFKKYPGLPLLIFLPVQLVMFGRTLWQEEISSYWAQDERIRDLITELAIGKKEKLAKRKGKPLSLDEVIKKLKERSLSEKEDFVNQLRSELGGQGKKPDRLLNIEEIKEMSDQGVAFGSHTLNHAILTNERSEGVWGEIRQSKKMLEAIVRKEVQSFSYPNGSYTEGMADILKEGGYRWAFICEEGLHKIENSHYKIKRKLIHQGVCEDMLGKYSEALAAFFLAG